MQVGIISSSGGSVIFEAFQILRKIEMPIKLIVVVDRDCGIENLCIEYNILCYKIIENDNDKFSELAADFFSKSGGVNFILLFFKRLVTDKVYNKFPTINIHPSLLPSFRGFNPIEKALKENVKFFGASIHLVDNTIDGGNIIGQIVAPIVTKDILILNKISFLQKTYLVLLIIDLFYKEIIEVDSKSLLVRFLIPLDYNVSVSPKINNILITTEFDKLMKRENINIFKL